MAGVSMHKFEEYFQKADLDRDGRISGAEAVAFLQGSNLPRQVLAQIWMHADQNHTGFLSRPEFYNALRLVTVAQSKRELSPDIVKAALYGPASAKIPPPQINVSTAPGPQPSPLSASPLTPVGATSQLSSQNIGLRGPAPPSSSINQKPGTMLSTSGINQQLQPVMSSTGMNQQFGMVPSSVGVNQQLLQVHPASTMNQQHFGQVPPMSTGMNSQFGQFQPSNTGMNQQYSQQYGQVPPSTNVNLQIFPSQGYNLKPPSSVPTGPPSNASVVTSGINVSGGMNGVDFPNSNNAWPVGKNVAASIGPTTQLLDRGVNPSMPSVPQNPQDSVSSFSVVKDPIVSSGIGPNSDAKFSGDMFSGNQPSFQKVSSVPQQPMSSLPTSSGIVPVTSNPQPLAKPDPFEALQGTLMKSSAAVPSAQAQSAPKSNQPSTTQVTSSVLTPGVQTGMGSSTSEASQVSWPKMTRAGIQKYAKVFMEVDSDRDGKISGDQARNLFLSWRLPREVLKQIWDLSDQDSDSMLSLREFCIALYLMERYREGHTLPSVLPNSVMLDETLLNLAGPPTTYANMGYNPAAGLRPQQGLPGAQSVPHAGLRPPMQPVVSQADGSMQFNQKNAGGHTMDNSHANQHSNGQMSSLDIGGQKASETTDKADNNEKVLLDSREKLEYYRSKMQDLVLYKSRCDNRLNEITERARADKGEAELLEKKYQEKYKQVAEIHSKLTIEEASFREIQERKMELQQAITKMEQGGSADGILQVRADRIQSDLEELLKALAERCKKHSIEVKSSALIELPPGWQPGIAEIAAVWDEDWDKFDDEGFSFDVALPENGKPASVQRENSFPANSYSHDSPSDASMPEKRSAVGAIAFDADSVFSADESKSPRGSPVRSTTYGSPSKEYSQDHFKKNSDGDAETHRGFDEPSWGDFDNNDDIDSVWGFNIKDSGNSKNEEKYFFGSNDFSASPERSSSPHVENAFPKNNLFFEDSVPGSPLSRADNSPRYSNEPRDPFDSFSRYDSFSVNDQTSSPRQENFSRFNSINSSRSFEHSSNYSFDESDPFGSTGPFKVASESSKRSFEKS